MIDKEDVILEAVKQLIDHIKQENKDDPYNQFEIRSIHIERRDSFIDNTIKVYAKGFPSSGWPLGTGYYKYAWYISSNDQIIADGV